MNEQFNEQQKEVLRLLKRLNDTGALEHMILIGSWAEYIYAIGGVLPGFSVTLRTIDVDFLVKNLRKPTDPVNVPALLSEEGYSTETDTMYGTIKYHSPGGLELEFLIPKRGSGSETILETNLGVTAQSLWHMTAVVNNAITANVLGMKVQVPCPEIYVLTKMIINDVRSPEKQLKDTRSIQKLLPYLDYDKLDALFASSTKKEKSSIHKFIQKNGEMVLELPIETRMKFSAFISKNMPESKALAAELAIDDRVI